MSKNLNPGPSHRFRAIYNSTYFSDLKISLQTPSLNCTLFVKGKHVFIPRWMYKSYVEKISFKRKDMVSAINPGFNLKTELY